MQVLFTTYQVVCFIDDKKYETELLDSLAMAENQVEYYRRNGGTHITVIIKKRYE